MFGQKRIMFIERRVMGWHLLESKGTNVPVYASASGKRLASVMEKFNKKIDRKNLNFGNKTAILKNM